MARSLPRLCKVILHTPVLIFLQFLLPTSFFYADAVVVKIDLTKSIAARGCIVFPGGGILWSAIREGILGHSGLETKKIIWTERHSEADFAEVWGFWLVSKSGCDRVQLRLYLLADEYLTSRSETMKASECWVTHQTNSILKCSISGQPLNGKPYQK